MGAYHVLYVKERYIRNFRKRIEKSYKENDYLRYKIEKELLSFLNLPDYIRSEYFENPIAKNEEILNLLER